LAEKIRELSFEEFINRTQVYHFNGKGRNISVEKEGIYKIAKNLLFAPILCIKNFLR